MTDKSPIFLTPKALAERWNIKESTLANWRWNGHTPTYLKLGNRVLYKIEDIERFELSKQRHSTSSAKGVYTIDMDALKKFAQGKING
jgi:hypothetical protein